MNEPRILRNEELGIEIDLKKVKLSKHGIRQQIVRGQGKKKVTNLRQELEESEIDIKKTRKKQEKGKKEIILKNNETFFVLVPTESRRWDYTVVTVTVPSSVKIPKKPPINKTPWRRKG